MRIAGPSIRSGVRRSTTLALVLVALIVRAEASSTTFDFVTFDGIDYLRWQEEPGRALVAADLGLEFGTIQCSLGEDVRGCPYGTDGGAAFLPAGTRMFMVRGHPSEFRLAAVWRDRTLLYQAWRNPRARVGGDLYRIAGRVRAVDVSGGEPWIAPARPATIAGPGEVQALVEMLVRAPVQRPAAHPAGERRYWLTFWLTDGTSLTRPFFVESREVMGGVRVPEEFATLLGRHVAD
jgi:hypothetical protein